MAIKISGTTVIDDSRQVIIPDKIIHSGDTNTAIRFPAADTFTVETAGGERMRIDDSGDVGIGTTSPSALLDVNGDALIYGVTVGRGTGSVLTNTAVGRNALLCNTTGDFNTAVGRSALICNTTGCSNTASGANALFSNTEGYDNTASGRNALLCNTTGCSNTASGMNALFSNTTGCSNTASGVNALRSNTTGCSNAAVGNDALFSNTTGCNNVGIGVNAGRTGSTPQGIVNITTESNRIVMGNDDHTCAQIKIAWTATSDCRDKTCFKPLKHGLEFVRALKPTEYQFKQGGRDSTTTDGKRRYGFLAQDILPLEGDNPVIISDDDPEKLQYTESHLIPVLVKAIQELTARIEELENNA